MKGIAKLPGGQKRATLFSLVRESIRLNREEEKQYQKMVRSDPLWEEVKMLESIEDVGYERGWEEAREELQEKLREGQAKVLENTAKKLLKSGWLTHDQIVEITGLDIGRIGEFAEALKSE